MVIEKMPENKGWSYYISLLQGDDELTDVQKKLILDGWIELKQIFDDEFIETSDKWHPLLGYLKNQALWSRLWLAFFGKRLTELRKEVPNELKQRLRGPEFFQTYAELEVASKFKENGYIINFVKRIKQKNKKTPDIIVEHGSRELCVEVTTIGPSSDWIKNRMIFLELTEFSHQYLGINYFCTIHKYPPTTKIKEIKEKITEKIEKVKESGYEEFVEPNVFECYICTDENIIRVPSEKRIIKGPREFIDGYNQILRIKRRIKNKVIQLRHLCRDKPNIVVIYDHSGFDLVIPFLLENRVDDLVSYFHKKINKSSELSALIVIWNFMNIEEERVEETENYAFSKRMEENKGIARYILTIKNTLAANPLTSEEIDLIKK